MRLMVFPYKKKPTCRHHLTSRNKDSKTKGEKGMKVNGAGPGTRRGDGC